MLWAILAALVPVIIYLIFFRRAVPQVWAAMEILLRAARKHQRRHRYEDLLLLSTRVLLVLCVGLALARPVLRSTVTGRGEAYHAIFALDVSASMGTQGVASSLFEQAQALAGRAVERLPGSPLLSVVRFAARSQVVEVTPSVERDRVRRLIAGTVLTGLGDDPAAGIAYLDALARTEPVSNTRIFLFSDFQRISWEQGGNRLSDALAALPGNVYFTLVPLRPADPENASLSGLEIVGDALATDRPVDLAVRIRWQGSAPFDDLPVELRVNAETVARRLVSLPPDGEERLILRHTFSVPGVQEVAVHLPDDALSADNETGIALDLAERLPILLVDEASAQGGAFGAADYIASVLAPREETAGNARSVLTPWEVRRIPPSALEREVLPEYRAVVVANLHALAVRERQRLGTYLEQGGGLFVVLGDGTDQRALNDLRLPLVDRGPVGQPGGDRDWGVRPGEGRHVLLTSFEGGALQRDLGAVRMMAGRRVEPTGEGRAQIVLTADGDWPVLIDTPVGSGRALVFCSHLVRDHGDLPLHPSFVALVSRAIALLAAHHLPPGRLWTGDSWIVPLPKRLLGGSPLVGLPDGTSLDADTMIEAATPDSQLFFSGTEQRGFYRFRRGQREPASRAVFAAVPEAESSLESMSDEALRTLFGDRLAELVGPDRQDAVGAAGPLEQAEIWRWMVSVALLLVLLESWLARRFGAGWPLFRRQERSS